MGTILDLNVLTAPATGDWLLIRDISDASDKDKKMALGYLAWKDQAVTPTAARAVRWKDANTIEDAGFLVSDIARLSVAQTWTGVNTFSGANVFTPQQTFNGGALFGGAAPQSNLNYYREAGSFTPQFADAGSGGVQGTPTASMGAYTRIGNRVWIDIFFDNMPTTGMTGANFLYIRNLPFAAVSTTNYIAVGTAWTSRINFGGNHLSVRIGAGSTALLLYGHPGTGNATPPVVLISDLGGGTLVDLGISINYQCV